MEESGEEIYSMEEETKDPPTIGGTMYEPDPPSHNIGGLKLKFGAQKSPFEVPEHFYSYQIEISVINPIKNKSHHEYLVKGRDDEGEFEVYRRYKEFIVLQETLAQRWPGMYVPTIPPKKLWGNRKEDFVQERMHFLNRFAQTLTNYPFLFFSDETKLFVRASSEFRQAVKGLPKQVAEDILLKYKNQFKLESTFVDGQVLEDASSLIQSIKNLEPVITLLKQLLKTAEENSRAKFAVGGLYSLVCKQLTQYESLNIMEYADHDESKLILSKPPNDSTIGTLTSAIPEMMSPYTEINRWVKGELYEVKAYKNAIDSLINYIREKEKLATKMANNQTTLSKLQTGGSTLKTMFSSKKKEAEINNYVVSIPIMEKDIENMTRIINIATAYMRDVFLQDYKNKQLTSYYKLIKEFGKGQIDYSQKIVDSWTDILGDSNI